MATDTLIRLYVDSRKPGTCRGCAADVLWFETHPKGARMIMNATAVPVRIEQTPEQARPIGVFKSSDTHWSACPERAQFVRRTPADKQTGR